MGGECSTHGIDEKFIQDLVRKPEGEDHAEDIGEDGKIILEWILEKKGGNLW
jgi:hypothetical protein